MSDVNRVSVAVVETSHADFQHLVDALDAELEVFDGEDHEFYSQYNGLDSMLVSLVAYVNGQPVGCGAIKPFEDGVAEMKRMYVQPDHRRFGVAARVFRNIGNHGGGTWV